MLVDQLVVFYQTELALSLVAELAPLKNGALVRFVNFFAELACHVGQVAGSLLVGIEGFKRTREDRLVSWFEPALDALLVEALELLRLLEAVFVLDKVAALQKKHFYPAVGIDFLHFLVYFDRLLVASVLAKLLARERVLVEVDQGVLVQDASRVVEVCMAVLALESHHFAIFTQVLFKPLKTKFFKMTAKTFERVSRALPAFDVALQVSHGETLDRPGLAAPVAD